MSQWRNWAGDQKCSPTQVLAPSSVADVVRVVSETAASPGGTVKAVGAGHSFSDITLTRGTLLNLDGLSGLLSVDQGSKQVTLAAGTRLFDVPGLLAPYGLAMANLGDIDRQSLAGAISTGTHGTGLGFGGIATQIVGLEIVSGTGKLIECSASENADVFRAARVGLGALGIITAVTIQCVDAFTLHAVEKAEPLQEVLDSLLARQEDQDHFEFYWFPHTDMALTKSNTRYPLGQGPVEVDPLSARARLIDDVLVSNYLFDALCRVTHLAPRLIPTVNRTASKLTGNREFADASHRVFATQRSVKFREMEYAVPRAAVPEILSELNSMIERKRLSISFPVEVRCAAADDIPLSTAFERESGYIAVHQHIKSTAWEFFSEAEKIFLAYAGRPHWGKLHFLQSKDFQRLYPELDFFDRVRVGMDPKRVFRNAYLDRVLP